MEKNLKGNFNNRTNENASEKEQLEIFVKNLNIPKNTDCGINDTTGRCWWRNKILNYTNKGKEDTLTNSYTFIDNNNNAVYVYKHNYRGYVVLYDINGINNGPNKRGDDIFCFQTGS